MSERFVRGYKIATEELFAILGSGTLVSVTLKKANVNSFEDVMATLNADNLSLETLLKELNENKLNPKHAYGYSRLLELILNSQKSVLDEQVDIMASSFLNTESGDWNEVLKSAGLVRLSELWATNNFAFPWKKSIPKSDWPYWTLIEPEDITKILNEFKHFNEEKIRKSDDFFDATDEVNQKKEIIEGLIILNKWLISVKESGENESLLLQMDGDQ